MKLKSAKFKSINFGSLYRRGGTTHDKHGNVYHSNPTFRDIHSGNVYNKQGKLLGSEQNHKHQYGSDFKKTRTFQSPAQRKAVMAKLRGR